MKKHNFTAIVILLAVVGTLLSGCSSENGNKSKVKNSSTVNKVTNNEDKDSLSLKDDRSVYVNDKADEVVNMYVTVLKSYDDTGKAVTLKDLDGYRYYRGGKSPKLDIVFQEGNESGPDSKVYSAGEDDANGVIELRGHSTQSAMQKSYRIKLYKKAGLWRDQQTINLNKHPFDATKARNKLSFDYFKLIPNMTSLRTTYVHLHIKDLSANSSGKFEDMGLYVQIEQPNKRFLRMHGLDPSGNLYKAEFFEFFRYPETIMTADTKGYSKENFEKILEIKGSNDHSKLIKMLDAVNDYSQNINAVIDKYFDRDNYLTWMAANILFENLDVSTQNFYLYSPTNVDKWYFLPWDYDGGWGFNFEMKNINNASPWQKGIGRYWGSTLHQRFLKDPHNVKALNKKINELCKIVTKERTLKFINQYYKVTSKFETTLPDKLYTGVPVKDFAKNFYAIADTTQRSLSLYKKSLQSPMPVFLSVPVISSDKISFKWDNSYDLQGDDITYDFSISRTPSFTTTIYKKSNIYNTHVVIPRLSPGVYYYRVIIKDSKGHIQYPFDTYMDVDNVNYFGVIKFRVE